MKITRRDLDVDVLNKLDCLDKVKDTFDENNPDGFISYNPKSGFYFKKTNDTFLKKVFVEDEIVALEKALTSKDRNIRSTMYEDLRLDNKLNSATQSFLIANSLKVDCEVNGKILLTKETDDGFIHYTDAGLLYFRKGEDPVDILNLIKVNFNLGSKISAYDIVDIAYFDEKIYIASEYSGIYVFYPSTNVIELLMSVENVRAISITKTENLFVATEMFCAQYDLESGKCIEKYNNLRNCQQIPVSVISNKLGIFVMAVPIGIQTRKPLLHFWKLDAAGVGYNLADNMVERHSFDNAYQVMFEVSDEENIYFAGKLGNHKLFIWSYNMMTLKLSEKIIDVLDITTFDGFIVLNKKPVILSRGHLFVIEDNKITRHLVVPEDSKDLFLKDGDLYTVTPHSFINIDLGEFSSKKDNLMFRVYNGEEPCNNLDIFVKDASRKERITLINADTGNEIPPSYYIVYNNNSIIKLMNCSAKNIKMLISVDETTRLGGIVVKYNRMFLR